MTVFARPLPPRIAGNSIRPFRPALPTNNIRPFAPRVPAPLVRGFLRPNPWVLGVGAVVIAALVLWQLWGFLAGPSRQTTGTGGGYSTGTLTGTGIYAVTYRRIKTGPYTVCSTGAAGEWTNDTTATTNFGTAAHKVASLSVVVNTISTRYLCGAGTAGPLVGAVEVTSTSALNGSTTVSKLLPERDGNNPSSGFNSTATTTGTLLNVTRDGVSVWQPTEAAAGTPIAPRFNESPSAALTPRSAPQRSLSPAPSGDPVVQPATPAVATVPVPLPGVPQTPRTFPVLPGSIGLPNGFVPPALPEAPTTTAPDLHYPVAGGAPVGGLAQSPAATLAGIAAEVGRIEAKLNRLLNPLAPGDSTDLLQLLWQAIQALYNSMADNRPAGEYLLSTPCELDDDGDRIVSSVGYPETSDNTTAVLARIDALAALLQTHKDLKQPICRQTPAVGQPVQVQFVQIE
ncbi:MAG: hypothetical protein QM522_09065 [Chitinophagaceae bacterium]|nr:hypothetical protein [Chitinophagaceae bacterium]MDI9406840.1 hypothetical protein [Chitinophagaceae bacterium]